MKNSSLFLAALLFCAAGCGRTDSATDADPGADPGADTAQVQRPPATFTVSFALNGGSGDFAPVALDSGGAAGAPTAAPERAAHCFTGWFADSAATVKFDFGAPVRENVTAYAGWKRRHTVTLVNAGDALQRQTVCDGDTLTLAMPQKLDASFVDWYVDSGFTERFGGDCPVSSDTVLYARWVRALRIEVNEYSSSCPGYRNPFVFFAAYEDEEGTYSNELKSEEWSGAEVDKDGNYYSVTGSYSTGGEADAVCRAKGSGWYLPSKCEFSRMIRLTTPQPYQPFQNKTHYWTGTTYDASSAVSYESDSTNTLYWIGEKRNTDRYKVRCVWRP
jgi:uncharacterized repeat protein (TIGR02543 family)